jgi:hypothetical protein
MENLCQLSILISIVVIVFLLTRSIYSDGQGAIKIIRNFIQPENDVHAQIINEVKKELAKTGGDSLKDVRVQRTHPNQRFFRNKGQFY